jgi:hypothetical protein
MLLSPEILEMKAQLCFLSYETDMPFCPYSMCASASHSIATAGWRGRPSQERSLQQENKRNTIRVSLLLRYSQFIRKSAVISRVPVLHGFCMLSFSSCLFPSLNTPRMFSLPRLKAVNACTLVEKNEIACHAVPPLS